MFLFLLLVLTYTTFRCSDSDTDTIFFQRRLIPNSIVYLAAVSNPCHRRLGTLAISAQHILLGFRPDTDT